MPTITFDTGVASVSVTGSTLYTSGYFDDLYGQSIIETADDEIVVENDGNLVTIIEAILVIKNVDYTEGEALRTWIRGGAVFRLNTFSITSDNAESDLGEGKGVALSNVTFSKNSDKGVFKNKAPDRYDIKFPYSVKDV